MGIILFGELKWWAFHWRDRGLWAKKFRSQVNVAQVDSHWWAKKITHHWKCS